MALCWYSSSQKTTNGEQTTLGQKNDDYNNSNNYNYITTDVNQPYLLNTNITLTNEFVYSTPPYTASYYELGYNLTFGPNSGHCTNRTFGYSGWMYLGEGRCEFGRVPPKDEKEEEEEDVVWSSSSSSSSGGLLIILLLRLLWRQHPPHLQPQYQHRQQLSKTRLQQQQQQQL